MPSPWLRWLIILFWLATTGWLFWNDVQPRWRSGEPPSLRPDDTEEVQHGYRLPTFWTVHRENAAKKKLETVFHASTWIDYDSKAETFTINAKLDAPKQPGLKPVFVAKLVKLSAVSSAYRVNHSGQLLSLETTLQIQYDPKKSFLGNLLQLQAPDAQNDSGLEPISLRIWGEVRDRQFFAHFRADTKLLDKPIQKDFPGAEVSYTGSVLLPLHPVNHIRGLRLGQSWRQPLMDPLHGFSGSLRWLNARVLPQPEVLNLNGNEVRCSVIEYNNDDNELVARTWVAQESEQVLQQEAILDDGRWIMKRDLQRSNRIHLQVP